MIELSQTNYFDNLDQALFHRSNIENCGYGKDGSLGPLEGSSRQAVTTFLSDADIGEMQTNQGLLAADLAGEANAGEYTKKKRKKKKPAKGSGESASSTTPNSSSSLSCKGKRNTNSKRKKDKQGGKEDRPDLRTPFTKKYGYLTDMIPEYARQDWERDQLEADTEKIDWCDSERNTHSENLQSKIADLASSSQAIDASSALLEDPETGL